MFVEIIHTWNYEADCNSQFGHWNSQNHRYTDVAIKCLIEIKWRNKDNKR